MVCVYEIAHFLRILCYSVCIGVCFFCCEEGLRIVENIICPGCYAKNVLWFWRL